MTSCFHFLRRGATLLAATLALLHTAAPAQVPVGCSAQAPQSCRYQPEFSLNIFPNWIDFVLVDRARDNHRIPLRLRVPPPFASGESKLPLVVWNHGGATATIETESPLLTFDQQTSARRLDGFLRAGYASVHIARLPPERLTGRMVVQCASAGVFDTLVASDPPLTPDTLQRAVGLCKTFVGWHLWGPQNVAFVVDWLRRNPGLFQTSPSTDLDRVVVGGWSGGGATVLNIAGAPQVWPAPRELPPGVQHVVRQVGATLGLPLPRLQDVVLPPTVISGVVGFIDDSPRSPTWANGTSGFDADAFFAIDGRPFLFTSGRHDTGNDNLGPGAAPELSRSTSWWASAPGHKYLAWSPDVANHATMDLSAGGCNAGLQAGYCDALENLGLAFLDGAVRGRQQALQWLASDALALMTGERIELHRR